MRIFHLCLCNRWGGQEMLVHKVALAQKQRGHQICIVARQESPLAKAAELDGLELILYQSGFQRLTFPWKLRKETLKGEDPVLHFHQLRAVRRFIPFLPRTGNYVFTEHSPRPKSIASFYNSMVLSRLQRIIVVSKAQRQLISKQLGLREEQLSVVYNGIDPLHYHPLGKKEREQARRDYELPQGEKIVVCAGRLSEHKGQDLFLEAAKSILETRSDLRFEICGDIEAKTASQRDFIEALKSAIPPRHSGRIHFRGFVEDIAKYLACVDMVVMPSRYEPFGLVAAEAMACGTRLVVSRAGALPEVVEQGKYARLVENEDPKDLARGIRESLEEQDHSSLEKARQYVVEKFSLDSHLDSLEEIYRSCSCSSKK